MIPSQDGRRRVKGFCPFVDPSVAWVARHTFYHRAHPSNQGGCAFDLAVLCLHASARAYHCHCSIIDC